MSSLVEVVDVPALQELVDALDQVLGLPGVVHPAAHRLRTAAAELLADLEATASGVSA